MPLLGSVTAFLACLLLLASVLEVSGAGDNRIWVHATVKEDKPVRLFFDTGASFPALFRPAVERLQLKLIDSPLARDAKAGLGTNAVTEVIDFAWGPVKCGLQFLVLDLPDGTSTEADGVMSWTAFRSNVLVFSGGGLELSDGVPEWVKKWPAFDLKAASPLLEFGVDEASGASRFALADTGSPDGVALGHELWREWIATQADPPATMQSVYNPKAGIVVSKVVWADEVRIGRLRLTQVPVRELDPREEVPDRVAVVGLYGLSRLDCVVDGKDGRLFARPTQAAPLPYAHNRLGALFDPGANVQGVPAARVAPGSPAYLAGVRDGDVLVKVDYEDTARWMERLQRSGAGSPWKAAPGTRYLLTLKRGDTILEASVVLRDILAPRGPDTWSLTELRTKGVEGDPQAQRELAIAYFHGRRGLSRDAAEGIVWYRKAAEQGDAMAQSHLGRIYATGNGVSQDGEEAVKWLRSAADQGDVYAQGTLGICYLTGLGVAKDEAQGVTFLRQAAERAHPPAQVELSKCLASGRGVPKDLVEACKWAQVALWRHGDEEAVAKQLVDRLTRQMTPEEFLQSLRRAREFRRLHPAP